jgi:hypothetical protein
MKKTTRKKDADETGVRAILRARFAGLGKLAAQAGDGRPLLRGLRVAQDPAADRFVVVHGGVRVEFVLLLHDKDAPPTAEVECRRMDSAGATEAEAMARIRFSDAGEVLESTVSELIGENINQPEGAWSIVAAVIWDAMQA